MSRTRARPSPTRCPRDASPFRKGAGNAVELGAIVAFGFSPLWLLAGASDVLRGTRVYLDELVGELERAGVLVQESRFETVDDLLGALEGASGGTARLIDIPPLALSELKQTLVELRGDAGSLPPPEELARLFTGLRTQAAREQRSLLEVSTGIGLAFVVSARSVGSRHVAVPVPGGLAAAPRRRLRRLRPPRRRPVRPRHRRALRPRAAVAHRARAHAPAADLSRKSTGSPVAVSATLWDCCSVSPFPRALGAAMCCLFTALLAVGAARAGDFTATGSVTNVVDGDTIDVRLASGKSERIRIIGIDTPERGACWASEATSATRRLALGKRVTLIGDGTQDTRDRYGRLLA